MSYLLTDYQQELKSEFADFSRTTLNANVADRYRRGEFDQALWKFCGKQGVTGLPVAEEFGGLALSPLDTILALEGFSYGCEDGGLAFALGAHVLSCVVPVWLHGSQELKHRYLPQLCSGDFIASNAITEEQSGSAAFDMASRATSVEDGYQLSGTKSFCANAPVSHLCLAYAMTDHNKGYAGGVTAFLLDRKKHGYKVCGEIDKLGLRTCSTGRINLDGVSVSERHAVGKPGGGGPVFNQSMEWERIGLSAMHIGTMARLVERAVEFAKQRKPGRQTLSHYQAVTHTLADIQTNLEAGRLLVYRAAEELGTTKSAARSASIAKLFVSEKFRSSTVALMQIYASAGYEADSEIARCLQDAMAATIYSGTSEIQRNLIARWMGC